MRPHDGRLGTGIAIRALGALADAQTVPTAVFKLGTTTSRNDDLAGTVGGDIRLKF